MKEDNTRYAPLRTNGKKGKRRRKKEKTFR
jgi:hypothetical protein